MYNVLLHQQPFGDDSQNSSGVILSWPTFTTCIPYYTVRSSITALEKMIFQCKSPLIGDFQLLCLIISWLSRVIPIFYIVIHELSFLRSNPMPLKNTPSTALVEASNLAALNGSSVVVLGSKVCWNMDEIGFIPWYPMENGDLRILRGIWVGIYGDILWCN